MHYNTYSTHIRFYGAAMPYVVLEERGGGGGGGTAHHGVYI